jgi:hypothetical protein
MVRYNIGGTSVKLQSHRDEDSAPEPNPTGEILRHIVMRFAMDGTGHKHAALRHRIQHLLSAIRMDQQ